MLYSAHFHFPSPADVSDFSRTILPHRLDSIHSLSMDWSSVVHFGYQYMSKDEQNQWQLAWDILSRMKSLTELRIHAKISHVTRDSASLEPTRNMIKKIKPLKVFELVVPTPQLPLWDDFVRSGMEITVVGSSEGTAPHSTS